MFIKTRTGKEFLLIFEFFKYFFVVPCAGPGFVAFRTGSGVPSSSSPLLNVKQFPYL